MVQDEQTGLQKGWALYRLGRNSEALGIAIQLLGQDPQDVGAWVLRGWAIMPTSKKDADASAEQALKLDPQNPEVLYLAVRTAELRFAPGRAYEYARQLVAVAPERASSHRTMASAALGKGLSLRSATRDGAYEEALRHALEAQRLDPTNAENWVIEGRVHDTASEPHKARPALEHALRLDPLNVRAKQELAAMANKRGETADAMTTVMNLIRLDPRDRSSRRHLDDLVIELMSSFVWISLTVAWVIIIVGVVIGGGS